MKPSQIYYRLRKMLKLKCSLGVSTTCTQEPVCTAALPHLDFDPAFLARFPAPDLMKDRVEFLHEAEDFRWDAPWLFENRSALWNYNLHYFEFLFPLVRQWLDSGEERYLHKIEEMIRGWIRQNPLSAGGCGWDPYPLSLRLVNWISCYGYIAAALDDDFRQEILSSIREQYAQLTVKLEKDLLGNHYFEDLKALVICGVFFDDKAVITAALKELKAQCSEQILQDGMHFELSPMYHKIILEGMLRVTATLRQAGIPDLELESYLQPMIDAAYSLEEGLDRIPLFNDCGNNVAKSLDALLLTAGEAFGLQPEYRSSFPASGYYIFKTGDWKLIVDAGQPGPAFIPGHAHCDAMSFELFKAGKPVLVNCGTYAYQCADRLFFKNTSAHNTVMCDGVEQSQCWGSFRMAKRSQVVVKEVSKDSILMEMTDQHKHVVQRHIQLYPDEITIRDDCEGEHLKAYIHCNVPDWHGESNHWSINNELELSFPTNQNTTIEYMPYAPEYGISQDILTLVTDSENGLYCRIILA